MGHPDVPLVMYAYGGKRTTRRPQPYTPNDNLNDALGAIRVLGLELCEDDLRPHLNTVLVSVRERNKGAAEQVVISGILPILALSLRHRGPLAPLTAKLVAELANESVVRKGFGDAGLVPALLSVLTSPDQEVLLHAARAVARVSYDSPKLQELLLRGGAVPRLVAVLLGSPDAAALEEACLLGLCNLSGVGVAEGAGVAWERAASARPGESVFCGVSPPGACGLAPSVTLVRVARWAPGQHAVGVEVLRRRRRSSSFSSSVLSLRGNKQTARWFPFSRFCKRNVPRTTSLKTRMFHTFL